ncbi:MAG TPA: class I SAM-dependent methyltransferase, partial [Ktedonobacterales bacterium]|nr:class I SAM-dependent methyltransferase [Ktedonobacterales bacterium]
SRIISLLVKIIKDYLAVANVPRHILDVGCGHGVIAARVLDGIPDATLVGVDGSLPMLAMARERLAPFGARASLMQADFEVMTPADLAGGPFGIAFASQSIHNCSDEGKQNTLASCRAVMAQGGLFLLYDRIKLATPALFPVYRSVWDTTGADFGGQQHEGDSFAEHEQTRITRGDRPGSLDHNVLWLREAGFGEVAVVQAVGIRALIAAIAP